MLISSHRLRTANLSRAATQLSTVSNHYRDRNRTHKLAIEATLPSDTPSAIRNSPAVSHTNQPRACPATDIFLKALSRNNSPPTAIMNNPPVLSFNDEQGRRRAVLQQEVARFYHNQRPYFNFGYEPPFGTVSMSQIEKLAATEIAGIAPRDAFSGWRPISLGVSAFEEDYSDEVARARLFQRFQDGEMTEEEEGGETESEDEDEDENKAAQQGKGLGPYKDWNNISSIVVLKIDAKKLREKLAEIDRTVKNNLPANMTYRGTNSSTSTTVPSTTTGIAANNRAVSGRITKPTPGRFTNTTTRAIPTYTGTEPIPIAILTAAAAIRAVRENRDGLPTKSVLWEMEGFVHSKGRLNKKNPLREWAGDDRLFDGDVWGWLLE
ncbi:hypothetical protein M409DRAFT_51650 [Zasmidium cellare ATCC 36951]|uniref:Uncharacterized protein n=1 Tax=Zasmidium cellare ATCC 36951 TaxID=1080233 RepID=A0A6A6CUD1_ZASCE|nr:uncharacterized protein M409DRAFT_51650 [Zasmidium cellare ATCC 36951]KAF2170645.1 hypothetical protein M409DRAFT_51650 [Zasmidium cellare ATCC 36951]